MLGDLLILAAFGLVTAAVTIGFASLFVRSGLLLRNFLIGTWTKVFTVSSRETPLPFPSSILDSLQRPLLVLGLACIFWAFWNLFRTFGFDLYQVALASLFVVLAAGLGLVVILLMYRLVKLMDWLVTLTEALWEALPFFAILLICGLGIWFVAYFLRRLSTALFTWPTSISIALLSGLAVLAAANLFTGLAHRRALRDRWTTAVPAISSAIREGDLEQAIELARKAGQGTPGALVAHTLETFQLYITEGNPSRSIAAARQAAKWSSGEVLRHAEKSMAMLRTISSVAPIVALFGTAWALVLAFRTISATPSPPPELVASAIRTALVDTAIGWAIAAISVLVYRIFAAGRRPLKEQLDTLQVDLLESLAKLHRASR